MSYCKKCGKMLPDDARFCDACGTLTEAAAAAEVQPQVVPAEGVPAGAEVPPVQEKSKIKLPFIIAGIVVVLAILGTVLYFALRKDNEEDEKSDGERLKAAIHNTLTAKSFSCEGSATIGAEGVKFSGEIIGNTDKRSLFFSITNSDNNTDSYAVFDEKIYVMSGNSRGNVLYTDLDIDQTSKDVLEKIFERDLVGAVKASPELEKEIKEYCKNYDEIPTILYKVLKECIDSGDDLDFVKSVKAKEESFTVELDSQKLAKALKNDYGVDVDSEIYNDAMDELHTYSIGQATLKFTLDDGYVTKITAEVEVGRTTAEAVVRFSSINAVSAEDSEAAKLKKEAEEHKHSGEPKDEKINLTMWCVATDYDSNRWAYEQAVADMLEKYPNVKFVWEAFDSQVYDLRLKAASAGNQLPDIFYTKVKEDVLPELVRDGKLYCLDDAYTKYAANSLPEKMCRNVTFDGKKYGVPTAMYTVNLFANMDILRKVGYVEIPSTYAELIDCCNKLVAAGYTPFGVAANETWCLSEVVEPIMLKVCGAETLDAIFRGNADWYNGDIAGAIDIFRDMYGKYFSSDSQYVNNDTIRGDFLLGLYAFYMNGSWNAADFSKNEYNIRAGEFPVINVEKGRLGQLIGGVSGALSVSASSENAEFAAKFAFELGQLLSKYQYLSNNGSPAWKIDYDDSAVDPISREIAKMVAESDSLVLFGDTIMSQSDLEKYYGTLSILHNNVSGFDGEQFVKRLDRAEFPNGSLDIYGKQGGNYGQRDLRGLEIVISDWWSYTDFDTPKNEEEERFWEWHHSMEEKYNYHIVRHGTGRSSTQGYDDSIDSRMYSGYGWGDQAEKNLLAITDGWPLGSIVTFDYRFIGAMMDSEEMLFCDLSEVSEFNFDDKKWNQSVRELMTIQGHIYGWSVGNEPRTGIFFNKDLMDATLGDGASSKPYDLQASGMWTWDEFKDLAKALCRDDASGRRIQYGFTAQQSVFFEMAWVSNGHAIVSRNNETGRYINNATSKEIVADMEWAYSFYDEGIMRRQNDAEASRGEWNYFEYMFQRQEAVMIAYDEYKVSEFAAVYNGERVYDFDFGFVCFPKGPEASEYISIVRENILVIPVSDQNKERLADIAFAYNIFTDPVPYDDDPGWPGTNDEYYRYCFRDSRAMNETLDILLNGRKVIDLGYIVPGLWDNNTGVVQAQLLYRIDSAEKRPGQTLGEVSPKIQQCLDDFTAKRLK